MASVCLVAPSLTAGLAADDFIHALVLQGSTAFKGWLHPPLDLFRFASPEDNRALLEDGIFPWWADLDVRFAFFRPFTAATHWLDYALWPSAEWMMHVQNIAWWALGATAVAVLYLELMKPRWVAALAIFFYVLDDARGSPVSWIANRNALIGLAFSVIAFVLFLRPSRRAKVLGPLAFGLGLLSVEGAISIFAYLLSYWFFVDRTRARLLSMWPYALVAVAWLATARVLGYGVSGSGVYFDPVGELGLFWGHFPARAPVLLFSAVGGPWAEGVNIYPHVIPGIENVIVVLSTIAVVALGALLVPLWKRSATARFWTAGALASLVPACAAFPADRLLLWVALGVMGTLAEFVAFAISEAAALSKLRTIASRSVVAALMASNAFVAPLLLPLRSRGIADVRASLDRADNSVPSTPDIRERTIIYVNPPADPFAIYTPITREALGVPRARTQRWLSTGVGAVTVERTSQKTITARPEGGFMVTSAEQILRSPRKPLRVGDVVDIDGFRVTVTEVTPDGRPAAASFELDVPLEDPSLLWLAWEGTRFVPFEVPPVGGRATIPAVNLVAVALGADHPAAKALARR